MKDSKNKSDYSYGQPKKKKRDKMVKDTEAFSLGRITAMQQQKDKELAMGAFQNMLMMQQAQMVKNEVTNLLSELRMQMNEAQSMMSAPPIPGMMPNDPMMMGGGMPPEMGMAPEMGGGMPPEMGAPPMV